MYHDFLMKLIHITTLYSMYVQLYIYPLLGAGFHCKNVDFDFESVLLCIVERGHKSSKRRSSGDGSKHRKHKKTSSKTRRHKKDEQGKYMHTS